MLYVLRLLLNTITFYFVKMLKPLATAEALSEATITRITRHDGMCPVAQNS
jgi:hypothetical protein